MLTNRGIKANPAKCEAVIQMKSPTCLKEVQKLNGRITALNRFIPRSAARSIPLFKALKKGAAFEWTPECEEAFLDLKRVLTSPPVLAKPVLGEPLILYISVTDQAISSVLVREENKAQHQIYFVSRTLQGLEARYQKLEKAALAIVTSARRLRHYFQSHPIIVRTYLPIRTVLHKLDLSGRLTNWAIELSEFDIVFEPRPTLKAQILADFIAELNPPATQTSKPHNWTIFVDGSSNRKGGGAGIVLEDEEGVCLEQSLRFDFKTSNNQAEYEACLAGLTMERELGAKDVTLCSDSQLVVSQVNGEYQAKEPLLQKYLDKVRDVSSTFDHVTFQHVPREKNARADILSRLASTKKVGNHKTVLQETLSAPSINLEPPTLVLVVGDLNDWRTPLQLFIEKGELPSENKEAKRIRRIAPRFTMIKENSTKEVFPLHC